MEYFEYDAKAFGFILQVPRNLLSRMNFKMSCVKGGKKHPHRHK